MSRRIAVGMISHETNVFSPIPTPMQAWKDRAYTVGDDVLSLYTGTKTAVGAFIEVAGGQGWEIIPTVCASAMPSAPTTADIYQLLKGQLVDPIRETRPDAVLLHLHGAMIAEGLEDPEGDIVESIKAIDPDMPVLLVMDLHGNITANMCSHCDGVFAYDTNPHIDGYERGLEAAEALRRIFSEGLRPVVKHAHPAMLPPTINMRTAEGPMVELLTLAREWEGRLGINNVSVFGGFPYGDVPHAGTSIVTTGTDANVAQACSDALAQRAWELRSQFLKALPGPAEALDQTEALLAVVDPRPVVIADVADNPGGGGSGDTPELLRELIRRDIPGAAAAAIWDRETARHAVEVGVGGLGEFNLAGKADPAYGEPIRVRGRVRAITDGLFIATGPVGRGMQWNMGTSVLLQVGHTAVVVSSIRIACNDADVFRAMGVQPERCSVLLVKSRGHFRASFEPLARAIVEVDAPGAANPNLRRYAYQRLSRPIWPLDDVTERA